jgi:CheY-like chemotaxis protein
MTDLAGRRILVVEDEMLIALLIESLLKEMGCVVSKASGLDEAMALIDDQPHGFDAATLNLGLNGEKADELAALLQARTTPFIVVTGYTEPQILDRFAGKPVVSKPLVPEDLEAALRQAIFNAEHI